MNGEQPWIRLGDGRLEGYRRLQPHQRALCARHGRRARHRGGRSSTRAAGRARKATIAAERRVVEVLQAVSSYSITADAMSMTGSGGTLRFRALAGTEMGGGACRGSRDSAPLGRHRHERSAALAGAPRATSASRRWATRRAWSSGGDGRVTGYTGCNHAQRYLQALGRPDRGGGGDHQACLRGCGRRFRGGPRRHPHRQPPRFDERRATSCITGAKGAKVFELDQSPAELLALDLDVRP